MKRLLITRVSSGLPASLIYINGDDAGCLILESWLLQSPCLLLTLEGKFIRSVFLSLGDANWYLSSPEQMTAIRPPLTTSSNHPIKI